MSCVQFRLIRAATQRQWEIVPDKVAALSVWNVLVYLARQSTYLTVCYSSLWGFLVNTKSWQLVKEDLSPLSGAIGHLSTGAGQSLLCYPSQAYSKWQVAQHAMETACRALCSYSLKVFVPLHFQRLHFGTRRRIRIADILWQSFIHNMIKHWHCFVLLDKIWLWISNCWFIPL